MKSLQISDVFITQSIITVALGIILATLMLFAPRLADGIISEIVRLSQDAPEYMRYLIDIIGAALQG